jgi:hypothetical protein
MFVICCVALARYCKRLVPTCLVPSRGSTDWRSVQQAPGVVGAAPTWIAKRLPILRDNHPSSSNHSYDSCADEHAR